MNKQRVHVSLPTILLSLRFVVAVFLPPLLTLFWVCVFEMLEKHGYHTKLPSFSDQDIFARMFFFPIMLLIGMGTSMLSGFVMFLFYELYLLRRHNIAKWQAHVIVQLLGIAIYIVVMLCSETTCFFLHPVYFIPVILTIGLTTSIYLQLYSPRSSKKS